MVAAGIVLAIFNVAAVAWFAWQLVRIGDNLVVVVHDAVETEVRRQDDRIEKRMARAAGTEEESDGTEQGQAEALRAGQPMRR